MSERNKPGELSVTVAVVPNEVLLRIGEPMPEVPRVDVLEPVSIEPQQMIDAVEALPDEYVPIVVVPPSQDEAGNDISYDDDSRPVAKTQLFGIAEDIQHGIHADHTSEPIHAYKPEITTPNGEEPEPFVARRLAVVAFVSGEDQPVVQKVIDL